MRAEAGVGSDEHEEVLDFGFHWPADVVIRSFQGLRLFNQLPFPGGWLDQPADLMDDIMDCFFLLSNESVRLRPQIDAALERKYESGKTDIPDLF